MSEKQCPRCQLWNPSSAEICDCGYNFQNHCTAFFGVLIGSAVAGYLCGKKEKAGQAVTGGAIAGGIVGVPFGIIVGAWGVYIKIESGFPLRNLEAMNPGAVA